jgi:hypothetical protein
MNNLSKNEKEQLNNLIINMASGLLPNQLCGFEIDLLIREYGKNWFEKLGYTEPEYKKP